MDKLKKLKMKGQISLKWLKERILFYKEPLIGALYIVMSLLGFWLLSYYLYHAPYYEIAFVFWFLKYLMIGPFVASLYYFYQQISCFKSDRYSKDLIQRSSLKMGKHAIALAFIIASLTFFSIPWLDNQAPEGGIKHDTIYITYKDTCEYCVVAKRPLKRAAFLYQQAHPDVTVYEIDLNKNTRLADDIRPHLQYAGSIAYITKDHDNIINYSRANRKEEPVGMPSRNYYQLLKEVTHNGSKH